MSSSISTGYEYINENEIDDELKCVICKQPFECPVSLSICHHTFCKQCIELWLNQKETCPTCRQVVITHHFERRYYHSYIPINIRAILDRLLIRCLFCNQTNIQRYQWKTHEKNCLKNQLNPSIINELKNELISIQIKHNKLKESVNILENKVNFLLKLINKGNLMTQYCKNSMNQCYYNHQNSHFNCSICKKFIHRKQILLHDCTGDCICHSCVYSQYTNHRNNLSTFNKENN